MGPPGIPGIIPKINGNGIGSTTTLIGPPGVPGRDGLPGIKGEKVWDLLIFLN